MVILFIVELFHSWIEPPSFVFFLQLVFFFFFNLILFNNHFFFLFAAFFDFFRTHVRPCVQVATPLEYNGRVSQVWAQREVESPEKSSWIDTSQLAVVSGANCSVCFLENTPLHSFLIFSYVALAIFASGNSNKSTKLHLLCGKLWKAKMAAIFPPRGVPRGHLER